MLGTSFMGIHENAWEGKRRKTNINKIIVPLHN
jgi:hypothetical protein